MFSRGDDFNGGWKRDAGERAASLTSTALSLQYRIRDDLEFRGSFDNRRNVRLARDRETPESDFDDTYRLGWSLDSDWNPGSRLRIGLGFRTYSGASESSSNATTARARLTRLTPWFLDVSARTTRYTGPSLDGWLVLIPPRVSADTPPRVPPNTNPCAPPANCHKQTGKVPARLLRLIERRRC